MELFGEPKEPWLRTFLELPHGIPSHDTFKRLLAALDPQRFLEAFRRWTQRLRTARAGEVVAIDGRGGGRENREAGGRARGAAPRALDAGQSPKVIVSAWAHEPRARPRPARGR